VIAIRMVAKKSLLLLVVPDTLLLLARFVAVTLLLWKFNAAHQFCFRSALIALGGHD